MKNSTKNFIEFIRNRGVMGFAIGFILGKATSDLIGSFVNDIINPLVGIITGNFEDLSKMSAHVGTASVNYGNFIVFLINFLILALVVYIIFKAFRLERLDKQPEAK